LLRGRDVAWHLMAAGLARDRLAVASCTRRSYGRSRSRQATD